jgi:hypothetical protein
MSKKTRLESVGTLSLRSLAAMRIATAILLIADTVDRAATIGSDYTDSGIFPRAAMSNVPGLENIWSFLMINGDPFFVSTCFALTIVAAILLLIGWRTSAMTPICWLLLLSLQGRIPHANDSGDVILRTILFWGIFLPWGERWSVRVRQSERSIPTRHEPYPTEVCSCGTLAYILQIVIIYIFSVLWKFNRSWTIDGDAVYWALHLDKWTSDIGKALLDLPQTYLKLATHLTILIELAPLLLLLPFWIEIAPKSYQKIRLFLVLLLWGFHLSLGIFLSIGLLSWICCVAWIGLLPDSFWLNRPIRHLEDLRLRLIQKSLASNIITRWSKVAEQWWRSIYGVVPLILITLVFWLNGASATPNPQPRWLVDTASSIGLVQRWDMFAGMPFRNDGWLLIELRTENEPLGTYNISKQNVSNWRTPVSYRGYRHKRIEHYLINEKKYRQSALKGFCFLDKRATQADLYLVSDLTPLPGYPKDLPSKRKIYSLHCPSSNNFNLTPIERNSIELLGG